MKIANKSTIELRAIQYDWPLVAQNIHLQTTSTVSQIANRMFACPLIFAHPRLLYCLSSSMLPGAVR